MRHENCKTGLHQISLTFLEYTCPNPKQFMLATRLFITWALAVGEIKTEVLAQERVLMWLGDTLRQLCVHHGRDSARLFEGPKPHSAFSSI